MPTSPHRQFAQDWINSTWQEGFRFGLLIRGPDWDYDMPRRRHARLKGKQRAKTPFIREQEDDAFSNFLTPILLGLHDGTLDAAQARERIKGQGYESAVLLTDTREGLISAIAQILDEGCNCWDDGGRYAWKDNGMFWVHFWYDPSHDHSGRK